MRDHGGNVDAAMARFGGGGGDWIDLSTGINPRAYPLPEIPVRAWQALPSASELAGLANVAARAFATEACVVPVPGAQAAIQLVPGLRRAGRARIVEPTYNEHAACLRSAGWEVEGAGGLAGLTGADLAVVVNPNNPDGRRFDPDALLELAGRVGLLLVDESFADPHQELSLASRIGPETGRIVLLRSFGKFYGLAGLRLGFVICGQGIAEQLRASLGPWPVSGPAISVAGTAYSDGEWKAASVRRLQRDSARLDSIASGAGWQVLGGTTLFRLYDTGPDAQERLGAARIWSRSFPYAPGWLRLGLPDGDGQWQRLEEALA